MSLPECDSQGTLIPFIVVVFVNSLDLCRGGWHFGRQVSRASVVPVFSLAPKGEPAPNLQPHIRIRELHGHAKKVPIFLRVFPVVSFTCVVCGVCGLSAMAKNRYVRNLQDSDTMESHQVRKASGASTAARSRASSLSAQAVGDEGVAEMAGEDEGAERDPPSSLLVPGTDDHIKSEQYVTMELSGVDLGALALKSERGGAVLCAFSLLPHENKLSVLHFTLQRCGEYTGPIKSKDELVFQVPLPFSSHFLTSHPPPTTRP
jgi:hypothetical protein